MAMIAMNANAQTERPDSLEEVNVAFKTVKKGDLLFWGPSSAPYHVGIYVGGGQYVHAATPSQGVRKQTLSGYFWPSTAKRII